MSNSDRLIKELRAQFTSLDEQTANCIGGSFNATSDAFAASNSAQRQPTVTFTGGISNCGAGLSGGHAQYHDPRTVPYQHYIDLHAQLVKQELETKQLEIKLMKEQKRNAINPGFFGRLFGRRYRMYLNELTHSHNLALEEINARLVREKGNWEEDRERLKKQLTEDSDLKLKEAVVAARLEADQRIASIKLEGDRRVVSEIEKLNKDHYSKLSEAMTKLHEEGNVTTKFTQDLALKMMEGMPKARLETKVITSGND